eukprot:TRINITY_DN17927_c0_g1_i1.p1 TRINITY_DN17927_c0_g1~~TRINITY_DN17927_c0_g1_i1.p1  ORF type:complete len:187 (-),score=42.30 TRINITY_DN17927_c0_g1_i1:117-677(-)
MKWGRWTWDKYFENFKEAIHKRHICVEDWERPDNITLVIKYSVSSKLLSEGKITMKPEAEESVPSQLAQVFSRLLNYADSCVNKPSPEQTKQIEELQRQVDSLQHSASSELMSPSSSQQMLMSSQEDIHMLSSQETMAEAFSQSSSSGAKRKAKAPIRDKLQPTRTKKPKVSKGFKLGGLPANENT